MTKIEVNGKSFEDTNNSNILIDIDNCGSMSIKIKTDNYNRNITINNKTNNIKK